MKVGVSTWEIGGFFANDSGYLMVVHQISEEGVSLKGLTLNVAL